MILKIYYFLFSAFFCTYKAFTYTLECENVSFETGEALATVASFTVDAPPIGTYPWIVSALINVC